MWPFLAAVLTLIGCSSAKWPGDQKVDLLHYQQVATEIESPTVNAPSDERLLSTPPPGNIRDAATVQYWDLSLEQAMHYALCHSRVLLDLGGTVLRSPENITTNYGVAVQETDPQSGPEAALSAFDVQFSSSLTWEKRDTPENVNTFGLFSLLFEPVDREDLGTFQAKLSKVTDTGGTFSVTHNVEYAKTNNPTSAYPSDWNVNLVAEMRQPLLQGGGVEFNRIAGPGARPGVFNGVLVARLRTDVGLADFEIGLRDFVSNVENAYWDLYFAYRDLDVKIKARDEALKTWRNINAKHASGERGGEADKEAQAREQYFRFEEDVENALVGQLVDGTRTNNGTTPGTFRGQPGVRAAERKLRLLMGLPATDDRLLRPSDEPSLAPIVFDWSQVSSEALVEREELRRQRWVIKSRELELIASKNFLLPKLDFLAQYRWLGMGNRLDGADPLNTNTLATPPGVAPPDSSAYRTLTDGEFQEWQLGFQLNMPLGFRKEAAGVRNAQLHLTQARCLLQEQERQVANDLSNAVSDVDRAYTVLQTDINRTVAAKDQLQSLEAAYGADKVELFVLLDAQRRYAEALTRYYQVRVEYAIAIRNVHFEKGSLLQYYEIAMSEGAWPGKAYHDAAQRERLRGRAKQMDYGMRRPPVVSQGSVCPAEIAPEPPARPADSAPEPPPPSGPVEVSATALPGRSESDHPVSATVVPPGKQDATGS